MVTFSTLALLVTLTGSGALGPEPGDPRPVAPLRGALVLASGGKLPDCVLQSFLQLSGGATGDLVLVSGRKTPKVKRWRKLGATSVESLRISTGDELRSDDVLLALLKADGIWLEDVADGLIADPLFRSLLRSTLARNGVVGGTAEGAEALAAAHLKGGRLMKGCLGLLPASVLSLGHRSSKDSRLEKALESCPGFVGWGVPQGVALVVHHGRRAGAMGSGEVTALIAPNGEWPRRLERINAVDVVDHGDLPPYGLDLLAWRRAARQRTRPPFPPETVPVPRVARGTLILHGGSGVGEETFRRFIEEAGGTDAVIVCIPSGAEIDEGDEPRSYSARELRDLGCKNVFILHTTHPEVADGDETFLAPLIEATAVWIDGGRTYRLIDSFQHTRAHRLLFDVLRRGGVVAGSSAGCQVLGDFLVRGNPRTNDQLEFEGYTTGFGLLKGVIIDAHFRQRDRGQPFLELLQRHPQMLGIGIDEKTALVVQGTTAEVVGEHVASFYDLSGKRRRGTEDAGALELRAGESYDLKRRARRK